MTQDAFEVRVMALADTLYRVSGTLLREPSDRQDAVQAAIFSAWRHLGRVREETFKAWLVRILINECYTILRRQRRLVPMGQAVLVEEAVDGGGLLQDSAMALRDAVGNLPERLRVCVVLHYLEDMPVRDIARVQRVPEGTVKSRLHAGRKALRAALGEEAFTE